MINKRVKDLKHGLTVPLLKGIILEDKKKDGASLDGQMKLNTKVIFKIMKSMVKAPTNEPMIEYIQAIGNWIKCLVRENSFGLMEENTKVPIKKIKKRDLEFLHGLMGNNIQEIGLMVNNQVKVK